MKTLTQLELNVILDQHKRWLANQGGSRAVLSHTDLHHLDLSGVDLRRANLIRANLSGAQLSYADMSEAKMLNVDFYRADLYRTNFTDAQLSEGAFEKPLLSDTIITLRDASQPQCVRT
ncbi:pentapeptide repeat-containing protein [Vibrio renipiscarius]|uniref:pentapeptide repeat-containing protein n=1 Tax=Vibrio renipiscarius TaxID=1461322 RepID=UPI003553EC1F